MIHNDTIVALATPSGAGAIAVIRISGKDAITIASEVFQSIHNKDLTKQKSHTLHLGHVVDGDKVLDQVLVSLFKGTHSYTGEKHSGNFVPRLYFHPTTKSFSYYCVKVVVWHKLVNLPYARS